MRSMILIVLSLALTSTVNAVEPVNPKLDTKWKPTPLPQAKDGWSWLRWRTPHGDLLTIATNSTPRQLTSYGDLDRAMDFASSAHPNWLDTADFPSWGHEDHDYNPKFLKLKTNFIRNTASNTKRPTISYVMVNEEGERSFMAVGAVVSTSTSTYYIQHNSKRPISDDTVNHVLRQVVTHTVQSPHR